MLSLKSITKDYVAGDSRVEALRGVSIEFRKKEFVAILGPSGCGKTTLLNIIGGLDKYTSGDLSILGKSTKSFGDRDWDRYRNHSIGFVFQSYNLIPHQSVLSNVELALTLSGVSRSERRRKATEALCRVGLSDQIHKKPNQLSGGQMQRVAIARALVNDPEILLADEPTGALDSASSTQIMELLREISGDKLIIMVTHNPELAEKYADRKIKLLDGEIIEDTNPYEGEIYPNVSQKKEKAKKKKGRSSMSFLTALSLSLNNLMTKKTRTLLTSFAGSIGIIGIALILSVSSGVQAYIDRVQEDTLSSYPIMLQKESVDMNELASVMMQSDDEKETGHELDKVYASPILYDLMNKMNSMEKTKNNLGAFREHLENSGKFDEFISAVQYTYDLNFNIYTKNSDGKIIKSDIMEMMAEIYNMDTSMMQTENPMFSSFGNIDVWQEMLAGENGELINELLYEQYDIVYGAWPENKNEIVVIVNQNNEISDMSLYALGLKTAEELKANLLATREGEQIDLDTLGSWSYEEICSLEFKLIPSSEKYSKQENGTYIDITAENTASELHGDGAIPSYLYDSTNAIPLRVSGIIRQNDDATSAMMQGTLGYTAALTEYLIEDALGKDIVREQLENPDIDVLMGLPFKPQNFVEPTKEEKAEHFINSTKDATVEEKAKYYIELLSIPSSDYLASTVEAMLSGMTDEQINDMLITAFAAQFEELDKEKAEAQLSQITDEAKKEYANKILAMQITEQYAREVAARLQGTSTETLASLFDAEAASMSIDSLVAMNEKYMPSEYSESSYEENLKLIGYVDEGSPDGINIFAKTFEDKDAIADLITEYNESVTEEKQISYTDYVALLMSSITTIISAISYVLIAFVAISLVVSSIMIGIITYISVLERTKEIGILRAIGASKKDISRVFNAETLIVGFSAGAIGVGITLLLNLVINVILYALTAIGNLKATLPVGGMIALVLISMLLTFVAGLIPSRIAAKKDPVVALRSE